MPVPVLSTVKKRPGSKRKLSIDLDLDKPFLFCFGRAITWFSRKAPAKKMRVKRRARKVGVF